VTPSIIAFVPADETAVDTNRVFKMVDVYLSQKFIRGIFVFEHFYSKPVSVCGYRPPNYGTFKPQDVEYQIFSNSVWISITPAKYNDNVPEEFQLIPKEKYSLAIDLNPFLRMDGARCRVEIGGVYSDPFMVKLN